MDNAGRGGELLGIVSAVVNMQKLIIVRTWSSAENRLFLRKQDVPSKKAIATPSKMLRIVYLCCHSSLPIICGSKIWHEP